jgi:hypothetical protein
LNEAKLRVAAEVKATEEGRLRANAEASAKQEAKLRSVAESNAAAAKENAKTPERTKVTPAAKAKAKTRNQARARAKEERKCKAIAATEAAALEAEQTKVTAEKAEAERAASVTLKIQAEAAEAKPSRSLTPHKKTAKSVWFYTCEGERLGPVSFEELRAMAASSSLDPRLDMIWRQSMDAWKPAGQIDGLFERQNVSVKPKEALAQAASPSRSKPQKTRARMPIDESWPGARRRSLFLMTLVFPFAWHYALTETSPFLIKQFGQVMMGKILPFAVFVPLVTLVHFGLKRFVNLGMSRWWSFAIFAPILNLWVGYRCFVCPAGYAYHKKLDLPGIALAILYWLIVLSVGGILMLHFGAIDSPALEKQLRVLVHAAKMGR